DPAGSQQTATFGDDVVAGPAGGFVDDQQTVGPAAGSTGHSVFLDRWNRRFIGKIGQNLFDSSGTTNHLVLLEPQLGCAAEPGLAGDRALKPRSKLGEGIGDRLGALLVGGVVVVGDGTAEIGVGVDLGYADH